MATAMDSTTPSQATNPFSAKGTESFVDSKVIANSDKLFLLYFIIGNYFGPDLKGEGPKKSLFQRVAEGLPIYTADQLTGSFMRTVEMEQIYYYILRNVENHLPVKLLPLRQFFLGNLLTPGTDRYPQFTDLFPTLLHPHSVSENGCTVISNLTFIDNPDKSYIDLKDIERFKRLTSVDDLLVDRDAATFSSCRDGSALHDVKIEEAGHGVELPHISTRSSSKGAKLADSILRSTDHHAQGSASSSTSDQQNGPALLFLPSCPKEEDWSKMMAATENRLALSGTAAMGKVGKVVGLIDIGECDGAYFFRVSLPGVRKDPNEFKCRIEANGQVMIKGVTITGERTVYRFSQKFEMLSQNLCPPGQFSIFFQLPGPVDPSNISSKFSDGILEAIILKNRQTTH